MTIKYYVYINIHVETTLHFPLSIVSDILDIKIINIHICV